MTSGGSKVPDLPSTRMFAQRKETPELNISGSQVLVVLAAGICLVGPLVWVLVKYWLFVP